MSEICVFAGTTEGRRLVECLVGQPVKVCVCVATDYGEALIPRGENVEVLAGRLDGAGMRRLFEARRFDAVIDATHPFATLASETIQNACKQTGVGYIRLNRDGETADADAVYVDSIQGAADYLAGHEGAALLATGSKELAPYTRVRDYQNRFYPRVLPMASSLAACEAAGFAPAHIIAMQGPFSVDMNVATLESIGAKYLVTKESGRSGGFEEKLEAARRAGARCVVIGQPPQAEGMDYAQTVRWLVEKYGLTPAREVAVVGIGMGSRGTLTFEADEALRNCDCMIGARRMLEATADYGKPGFSEIAPRKIADCMAAHPDYRRFAVVMSGDSGFYSGTKKLLPMLKTDRVRVIPGLSSMQVLCARLQTSWDDARAISLHGREGSIVPEIRRTGKVFALMDGADAVKRVCADLIGAGMGDAVVSVGERLSYPDEKLTRGTALELKDYACAPLSAILVEHAVSKAFLPVGLPDEAFERNLGTEGAKAVPMTKSEVRAVSISKLKLTEDAVVYDIGAGTGSVSVELALNCPKGRVYAVECREDAAELIEKNRRRFALTNLEVVRGMAPEAMADLPAPTHAFIGGSSGNMAQIVARLLEKNPRVRIVINAIALESTGEIAQIIAQFGFEDAEVVQMNLSRSRKAGRVHLMTALNPITIAALQRREDEHED